MEARNPAHDSIQLEMKNFLGDELYAKYSHIRPLLALCTYRLRTYSGYGTFDMMFSTEETTPFLNIYRRCLYPFVFVKNLFTPAKQGKKVMLSSTVYKSGRYSALIEGLYGKTAIVQTNAATDIEVFSSRFSPASYLKYTFAAGRGKKVLSCTSISGKELKKAVLGWLMFSLNMYNAGETCHSNTAQADRYLSAMAEIFEKRVNVAAKALEKSGISQYITINQYNLRDMVLISACRKLGIRTKQLEHHASRFMHNTATENDIYRFCFVDEICCWNKSEVDFHTDIYRYETFFSDEKPVIYSVGNPEVSFEQAENALQKYNMENRITFMVSGILDSANEAAVKKQLDFRNQIFHSLKKLADRTGTGILVRYPPGLDMQFRKKEERQLLEMGFEISPSDRNSLYSDICGSRAVIGTISSVLGLAALMGRQVFQVYEKGEKYYITDSNIHPVSTEEIEHIDISVCTALQRDKSDFMDYNILLQ